MCVIRIVSAKTCVFALGPWGFFAHDFLPQGLWFCSFFAQRVGISPSQKIPRESARGGGGCVLTVGID